MSRIQFVIWTLAVLGLVALVADQSSKRATRKAVRRMERQMAQVLAQNEHNKSLIRETLRTAGVAQYASSFMEQHGS